MFMAIESGNHNIEFPINIDRTPRNLYDSVSDGEFVDSILRHFSLDPEKCLFTGRQINTCLRQSSLHPEKKVLYYLIIIKIILHEKRNKRKKVNTNFLQTFQNDLPFANTSDRVL